VARRTCALRDAVGYDDGFAAAFSGTPKKGELLLTRTHPAVEALAAHVLETALDPNLDDPGRRCGVIRTAAVTKRTTALLLRMRFHIVNQGRDGKQRPLLAEDLALVGFTGSPDRAGWLEPPVVEALLSADADANIDGAQAANAVSRILERFDQLQPHLDQVAEERGAILLDAHRRVRKATQSGVRALSIDVHKPADVLGIYVYLPATDLTGGGDA